MTDSQKRFFELTEHYEHLKDEMKKVRQELDLTMDILGVGTYHQDPVTGCVYKIVIPDGTYVEFRQIGYDRTAKANESRGTLSKKEAEENGFVLLGKAK